MGADKTEEVRAARLPPDESDELAERFGRSTEPTTICWGDGRKYGKNDRVLPTMMTKEEAVRVLARLEAKGCERAAIAIRSIRRRTP
jgi:hypothetical protein